MLCDFVFLMQFGEIQIEKSLVMIFPRPALFHFSRRILLCRYSSFNARDRVSHGYRTVNEIGINVFGNFWIAHGVTENIP